MIFMTTPMSLVYRSFPFELRQDDNMRLSLNERSFSCEVILYQRQSGKCSQIIGPHPCLINRSAQFLCHTSPRQKRRFPSLFHLLARVLDPRDKSCSLLTKSSHR